MKIKCLFLTALFVALTGMCFAQSKTAAVAPEKVVKDLYAARKSPRTDPFFQTKSRARLDKFFTKSLADVIWKDAVSVKPGEAGNLNFDPLFAAQDTDITNFVIGKADKNGVVKVRFKNFGKENEIKFFLTKENTASKTWKIETIMYSDAEDLGSMLEYAMMSDAEIKAAESANKLNGDYLVGAVKCTVTTNISGYWAKVECEDQENFQVIDTETLTFGTFNPDEKGRRGKFVLADDGSINKFIPVSGKEVKVVRVK